MSEENATVRALYRSCAIDGAPSPYDRLHAKVFYPAEFSGSDEERNSGVVPARSASAPFPVLVFFPGVNLGPEHYAWLANELADKGIVFVSFSFISEEMPGYVNLSPGLDLQALHPDSYAKTASASCLPALLQELDSLNTHGVLAGKLDLNKLVLGGHSGGGSAALLNAAKRWCPGLQACFSYAAHAGAATMLGWPEQSLMPLPGDVPVLMVGGELDGVIASSAHRYGSDKGDPSGIIERSFDHALPSHPAGSILAILRGANHFSLAWPKDGSTGRAYLEGEETVDGAKLRSELAALIFDFIAAKTAADTQAEKRLQLRQGQPEFTIYRSR